MPERAVTEMDGGASAGAAGDPPGWFGKLSALGDFASRRLPADWVQLCDQWLARSIQASRERLGVNWQDLYLSSPIWRFAWAPGVADRRWWFGVLMPSCDKVGRYFPLLIAQGRDSPPQDRASLDHLEAWWRHLAGSAMLTLEDHGGIEDFEVALAAAPAWPAHQIQVRPANNTQPPTLPDWTGHWAADLMRDRLLGCSLWWPLAEGGAATSVTLSHGLPAPDRFADLLSWRR